MAYMKSGDDKIQFNWRLPVSDYKELDTFAKKHCSPREKWEVGAAAIAAFNEMEEVDRLRWLFMIRRRRLDQAEKEALATTKTK